MFERNENHVRKRFFPFAILFFAKPSFLEWLNYGNHFPNKPWFLLVCITNLLKTLWEKEKLLVTSNFSFSHRVFYTFGEFSAIFIKFKLSSAKSFSLEASKTC